MSAYTHWHGMTRQWRGCVWLDRREAHGKVSICHVPACVWPLPNHGAH